MFWRFSFNIWRFFDFSVRRNVKFINRVDYFMNYEIVTYDQFKDIYCRLKEPEQERTHGYGKIVGIVAEVVIQDMNAEKILAVVDFQKIILFVIFVKEKEAIMNTNIITI